MSMSGLGQAPRGYELFSTLLPQQQQVLQQLLGGGGIESNPLFQQGSSFLSNLLSGSPEATAAFEKPYLKQYQQDILPQIAQRFSSQYGPGGQKSSAFQNALSGSAQDLSERLATLRSGLQMQALPQAFQAAQQPYSNLQNLLGISGMGATQTPQPFWQQALLGLLGGAGQALQGSFKFGGRNATTSDS